MKLHVAIKKEWKAQVIKMAEEAGYTVSNPQVEGPSPVLHLKGGRFRAPVVRAMLAEYPDRFWVVREVKS